MKKAFSIQPFGTINLPSFKLPVFTNPFSVIAELQQQVERLESSLKSMEDELEEWERDMGGMDFANSDYVEREDLVEEMRNLVNEEEYGELEDTVTELSETLEKFIAHIDPNFSAE